MDASLAVHIFETWEQSVHTRIQALKAATLENNDNDTTERSLAFLMQFSDDLDGLLKQHHPKAVAAAPKEVEEKKEEEVVEMAKTKKRKLVPLLKKMAVQKPEEEEVVVVVVKENKNKKAKLLLEEESPQAGGAAEAVTDPRFWFVATEMQKQRLIEVTAGTQHNVIRVDPSATKGWLSWADKCAVPNQLPRDALPTKRMFVYPYDLGLIVSETARHEIANALVDISDKELLEQTLNSFRISDTPDDDFITFSHLLMIEFRSNTSCYLVSLKRALGLHTKRFPWKLFVFMLTKILGGAYVESAQGVLSRFQK